MAVSKPHKVTRKEFNDHLSIMQILGIRHYDIAEIETISTHTPIEVESKDGVWAEYREGERFYSITIKIPPK